MVPLRKLASPKLEHTLKLHYTQSKYEGEEADSMKGSFIVECSCCGRKIDLHNCKENKDYTIEVHDGEECFFCSECNSK